jgi:hypothetical protein
MAFKIQIFHTESGFYLNTNHESDDLESLKPLLKTNAFAGTQFQIVDDKGRVRFGPASQERSAPMTVEDIAKSLGVPILTLVTSGSPTTAAIYYHALQRPRRTERSFKSNAARQPAVECPSLGGTTSLAFDA